MASTSEVPRPEKRVYVRAVGPKLKILLYVVFGLTALLGANSVYLSTITFLEWLASRLAWERQIFQDFFYQYMFLVHLALGLLLVVPFVVFGLVHLWATRQRKNRRAVRIGYALFFVGVAVLVTGVLLMRVGGFDLKQPMARSIIYWLHIACPLATVWLYWLHRLAGPRIKWKVGLTYLGAVAAVVCAMMVLHAQDPRQWYARQSQEGVKYFQPSRAKTATGAFVPAQTLMMDDYCKKCHADAYQGWFHSAHHVSSFNNPAYLASVRETREVSLKRQGNVRAARFCAGCHDPVPFFSGAFDQPDYDDVRDPTAHAGVTCTVCHSIHSVDSTRGNADYTLEEPIHYPFAFSQNPVLQWINNQLVKAKPSFHKKTFMKDFYRSAEYCSTCHKVDLAREVTNYKEFLRGQNHYDTYLLSGVSGHGARSFYYPEVAKTRCAECHMPLRKSSDFGAKAGEPFFAEAQELSIHSHAFPSANTALGHWRSAPEAVQEHQAFLQGTTRVDLFGVRQQGAEGFIDGQLLAPLRPTVPALKPGGKYLLEAVVRTLKLGHPLTQGTVDSNELWLDVTVTSGDRVIGRNGGIDARGEVDRWSYFFNVFMLDRYGNRINRRNAQDIFVPLYNHQIPPGAAAVGHYELEVPADISAPITVEVKLQYRKFDQEYLEFVTKAAKPGDLPIPGYTPGQPYRNDLPITTMAVDRVTFPIAGVDQPVDNAKVEIPPWQRWNDYGIGLFLEGQGGAKGELRQAAEAFTEVERLGRYDGPLNLARVYNAEGRIDEAVDAIARAAESKDPPAPPWTIAWLSGLLNRQQGHLVAAEKNFRAVLEDRTPEMARRRFDFSLDYEVINELGSTLFEQAKQQYGPARKEARDALLHEAIRQFERTLAIDSENVTAHHSLHLVYALLGDAAKAEEHRRLHEKYKPDDNARDRAVAAARQKYPAANHAAEALVIYPLHRPGAPGLAEPTATPTAPTAAAGGGGE
ncbi:MAG: multiheme c-type cytochrome [Pirellulales bacterium]